MDETIKCFIDAIAAAAREDVLAAESEAAACRAAEMEQIMASAEALAEQTRREGLLQVRSAGAQTLAARRTENRQKLLEYRRACAMETMVKVKARVRGYTTQPEYPERLVTLTEKALSCLGSPEEAVAFLRKEDMVHAAYLRGRIRSTALTVAEGEIYLGGVVVDCPALGRRVDMSFDTAILDAESRFGDISGLALDG